MNSPFEITYIAVAAAKKVPIYFDGALGRSLGVDSTNYYALSVQKRMEARRLAKLKPGMHDHTKQTPTVMKLVLAHLNLDLTQKEAYVALSRIGIRSFPDLIKAHDAFYKKARKEEVLALISAAQLKKIQLAFRAKFELRARLKAPTRNSTGRDSLISETKANSILYSIAKVYAFYAAQMCSILQKDYSKYGPAILAHGMFGKTLGGKLPAGFADSFKAGKKIAGTKAAGKVIDITKLKPLQFKKDSGHDIVERLPEMYEAFVASQNAKKGNIDPLAEHKEQLKKLRVKLTAARKEGKSGTFLMKLQKQIDTLKRNDYSVKRRSSAKKKTNSSEINKILHKKVGAEMYDFFRLVIPALKAKRVSAFLGKGDEDKIRSKIRETQIKLRMAVRGVTSVRRGPRMMYSKVKSTPARAAKIVLYKKKIAELRSEFKKAVAGTPNVSTWMIPYVGTNVSVKVKATGGAGRKVVLDRGLLAHRLVTRANSGKLKASDMEMSIALNAHDSKLLALGGIGRIITACGGSTIKAFQTVFQDIVEKVKDSVFVAEFSENAITSLDTATGKVTDQRLLRLNNISVAQQAEIVKRFAKDIKAWNPLKEELSAYLKEMNTSKATLANHYEVEPSSKEEMKLNREIIKEFMSHTHGVKELKLIDSWEVQPSKKLATILKNVADSSKLEVIRNVFHGTSHQTGSIILSRGFKIQGTQVTARAMGDVLYVAPNIDKSAQYMKVGGSFLGRKSKGDTVTGMILMGDIIVSGEPSRYPKPSNSGFDWTKIGSFKTEEIGLTSPNSQFIIRKAMVLEMKRGVVAPRAIRIDLAGDAKLPKSVTAFERPTKLVDSDYKRKKITKTKAAPKAEPKAKKVATKATTKSKSEVKTATKKAVVKKAAVKKSVTKKK